MRDDRGYRITGRKDRQSYVSFTVHGADPAGGFNGPVLADINDSDLDRDTGWHLRADSQSRQASSEKGSWLEMPPDAHHLFVRNYYLRSVQPRPTPTSRSSSTSSRWWTRAPPRCSQMRSIAERLTKGGRSGTRGDHGAAGVRDAGSDGAVRFQRAQHGRYAVELPQLGRRRRRCRRHLLQLGQLRTSARRGDRHGGDAAAEQLHERHAVERSHADAGISLASLVAEQCADPDRSGWRRTASSSARRIPASPIGWIPKVIGGGRSSGGSCSPKPIRSCRGAGSSKRPRWRGSFERSSGNWSGLQMRR